MRVRLYNSLWFKHIFFSDIKGKEKDWVRLKVQDFPLQKGEEEGRLQIGLNLFYSGI